LIVKTYIKPGALVRDSFVLAKQIYDSGFRPDILVVLWRGGTPVGIAVHEFLLYKGINTYHTVLKATSYTGIGERTTVQIEHSESLLKIIKAKAKVLLIDDIFDSGSTIRELRALVQKKTPHIKTATLYYKYKDGKNRPAHSPDFYVRKTRKWVVFPHELMGLSLAEIRRKDRFIHDLLMS